MRHVTVNLTCPCSIRCSCAVSRGHCHLEVSDRGWCSDNGSPRREAASSFSPSCTDAAFPYACGVVRSGRLKMCSASREEANGHAEHSSRPSTSGVMDDVTRSPCEGAVHRLQMLREVWIGHYLPHLQQCMRP